MDTNLCILCKFYENKVYNFNSKIYELGSLAFESDDNSETKINYYYNFMLDFIESHGNLVTSLKSRCLI